VTEVTQEVQNQKIICISKKLPFCMLQVDITVLPPACQEAKAQSVKEVSKAVSIPGFRKGKAPESIIKQQYGNHIEKEFRENLLRMGLNEAIKLLQIQLFRKGETAKVLKVEPVGDSYLIKAELECEPSVPEVQFEEVTIPDHNPATVKENDVDNTVRNVQLYHAKWHEVTERPAQEGDYVVVDLEVKSDTPYKAFDQSRFHNVESGMPGWARKAVTGMQVGETKPVTTELEPENDPATFEPQNCELKLLKIQTAELPALDEALAKKAGVENVEELRKAVKLDLMRTALDESREKLRSEMRKALVDKYPFELPLSEMGAIKDQAEDQVNRAIEAGEVAEDQRSQMLESLVQRGSRMTQLTLLILPVARKHFEHINPAELQQRMMKELTQHYYQTGQMLTEEQQTHLGEQLKSSLALEHALDEVIAKAKRS